VAQLGRKAAHRVLDTLNRAEVEKDETNYYVIS
jgi:hypothetical protein